MDAARLLEDLAGQFRVPGVRFEAGRGGLPRVAIETPAAEAHVYLLGAHVAHYQPRGAPPLLYLSSTSAFEPGRPIRGGVPVCFPFFGPAPQALVEAAGRPLPQHGFARLLTWDVSAVTAGGDSVTVALRLGDSPETRAAWPHPFEAILAVTIGRSLSMTLSVRNTGLAPETFEAALHTYFNVGDVARVSIAGLSGKAYLDNARGRAPARDDAPAVRFAGRLDRLYADADPRVTLDDPAAGRRIDIDKTGSGSTVVWNPGGALAPTMPDLGPGEWERFCCVETANAVAASVTLGPGATHAMTARLTVEPLPAGAASSAGAAASGASAAGAQVSQSAGVANGGESGNSGVANASGSAGVARAAVNGRGGADGSEGAGVGTGSAGAATSDVSGDGGAGVAGSGALS